MQQSQDTHVKLFAQTQTKSQKMHYRNQWRPH